MTDHDFLRLLRDVLTTEVFVSNASKVFEARQEVGKRLAAMDELQRTFMEAASEKPVDTHEWARP